MTDAVKTHCRVSLVQMNSSENVSQNLDVIHKAMSHAKSLAVDMVVLPENCSLMANQVDMLRFANQNSETVLTELCMLAKANQLWLVVGSLPSRSESADRYYSRLYVINSDGVIEGTYDKRHLFDVSLSEQETYAESSVITAGIERRVVETPWGGLGLSICYDLRFPEHYRAMLDSGMTMIVVPAAFTYHTGRKHWEPLLRARAIENQCYVLAVNQTGMHVGNRRTYGHSIVIGPDGETLAHCMETTQNIVAELDLASVSQLRHSFPVLSHRLNEPH